MAGMHQRGRWALVGRALPALFAVFVMGCSSAKPKLALVPVSGTITVNHQPLVVGTVVFHPDAARGNTSTVEPRAGIDPKAPGVYRLTTNDADGAPLGASIVTVYAMEVTSSARPTKWIAHPKYTDVQTSGLTRAVVQDPKAGAYDIELEPPN